MPNLSFPLKILVALTVLTPTAKADKTWYTHFGGKKHTVSITTSEIESLPTWNFENQQNLKIHPNKIYQVARDWTTKLDPDPKWRWLLDEQALVPVDRKQNKWVWKVQFEYEPENGNLAGQPVHLKTYLTLDGKLLNPHVRKIKRGDR